MLKDLYEKDAREEETPRVVWEKTIRVWAAAHRCVARG